MKVKNLYDNRFDIYRKMINKAATGAKNIARKQNEATKKVREMKIKLKAEKVRYQNQIDRVKKRSELAKELSDSWFDNPKGFDTKLKDIGDLGDIGKEAIELFNKTNAYYKKYT